jgi:type II secretory pathway component PulF
MNHATTKRSVAVTAVLLLAAALLWAAVAAVLVAVVPRYEFDFRERGVRLPDPTRWTLAAGHWAGAYWYVLPLFGLFILPVVVVLSWLLRHRAAGSWPGWLWFGALLGLPILIQLEIWLTLLLP